MKLNKKVLMIMAGLLFCSGALKAQIDPLSSQYYTNEYLGNPAMAGREHALKLNAVYRQLFSDVPGSPVTQNLSADYGFGKLGIGMKIQNESAGLQRQTRAVGTFAYHLPLNDRQDQLHFGISMGLMNQRIETRDVSGDPNDVLIGEYNERQSYLDGDFGLAYTTQRLTIQGSIPNLKNFTKKDNGKVADQGTFYAALAYKIIPNEKMNGMVIEPKIAFRGVKGFDNIIDAGAQFSFSDQQLFLTALYHSSKNASFGMGLNFRQKYLISGIYTTQTSDLSGYTNGNFEFNLRASIPNKK